jgi:hypothetical protein
LRAPCGVSALQAPCGAFFFEHLHCVSCSAPSSALQTDAGAPRRARTPHPAAQPAARPAHTPPTRRPGTGSGPSAWATAAPAPGCDLSAVECVPVDRASEVATKGSSGVPRSIPDPLSGRAGLYNQWPTCVLCATHACRQPSKCCETAAVVTYTLARMQGFDFALPATSKENFALRYMMQAKKLTSAWLPLTGAPSQGVHPSISLRVTPC